MKYLITPLLVGGLFLNNEPYEFKSSRVAILNDLVKIQQVKLEEETKQEELESMQNVERKAFNLYDVGEHSDISYTELYNYLQDNSQLSDYTNAFITASKEYNVNVIILTAITLLESGRGTSDITYSHNNISGTMYSDGNCYYYRYFNSIEECINYTARNLRVNYLNADGIYNNGVSLESVNINYCPPNENWHVEIGQISEEIKNYMED